MPYRAWPILLPLLLLGIIAGSATPISHAEEDGDRESIGERFHGQTSLTWPDIVLDLFRLKPDRPAAYKSYSGATVTKLPKPDYRGVPLEESLAERRSVRNYAKKSMPLSTLSQLLFAAQGVTGKIYGHTLRTAPSAGALYPFEVYVVVNRVTDLPKGIYHYAIEAHALEQVREGDFSGELTSAGLNQEMLGEANVTFALAAVFDRIRHKYGERGYRYTYMEAGHISQNIALQAVSLGLGSVPVGAFLDKKVNELIGVDGRREAVIYLHAVGML